MSTIVDGGFRGFALLNGLTQGGLTFTAHAQVRYLERYIDSDAVMKARKVATGDNAALAILADKYAAELAAYMHAVDATVSRLRARFGHLPFARFSIAVGSLRVAVVGDACVTTLPPRLKRRPSRRPATGRRSRAAPANPTSPRVHDFP